MSAPDQDRDQDDGPAWFDVACDRLRTASIPGATLLLEQDPQLRILLAFWGEARGALGPVDQVVTRTAELAGIEKRDPRELRTWAWTARPLDRTVAIRALRAVLGEAFPVREKMAQAIAAGLALPDGTIHGQADTFIQLKTAQSIKGAAGRAR